MSRANFRRVARLEKRALPYIERKRRCAAEQEASNRERNFVIVANLALLILHGDPKIGEPLIYAWRRCLESKAWKTCRERHPDYIGCHGCDEEGPFNSWGAGWIAQYFRKYFLPELPGANETEKLNGVFAKAPAWLLWFTHGDIQGHVLGLNVPDLSSKSRFARPSPSFTKLPDGAFEWRILPDGAEDEFLTLVREEERRKLALVDNLTPRERKRALRIQENDQMSAAAPRRSKTDESDSDGDCSDRA